ncbi:uncharacterized protein PRCAT00005075001 [Priceomyces carsonii]|uniref:uncharacterized protein n=1 Tax=Priceomyces carsonii TaxID=28549 RepID=UPI002ED7A7C4|nr:unnamed protein product [Priceomyces carsonii]
MNVLILGMGGVGIIAAYGLEYGGKSTVTSIVRSNYVTLKQKGYKLSSVDYGIIENYKPANMVSSVEEAVSYGPFQFIVVTTKNIPEICKIEDLIEKVVEPKLTTIVLIQNGIGIEKPLLKKFSQNVVLSGVSMISSTLYNGEVNHEGLDSLGIGYFKNLQLEDLFQEITARSFIDLYNNGKNYCFYQEDVNYGRWKKLVYNASLNATCALTNCDVGRLELFGVTESVIRPAMKEIIEIAKSEGVFLPDGIDDDMIRCDEKNWYLPSMGVDLRKGNLMELETILGNCLQIARSHKVQTITLKILYSLLKSIQLRLMEEKNLLKLPKERPIPGEEAFKYF